MRVFSITVPNPYVGEGSKNADRVAPIGHTERSYFTVFARDLEDARKLFVDFCGRGSRVPTLTQIQEIGVDERVCNRVVIDQMPVVYESVEVSNLTPQNAQKVLLEYLEANGADPLVAQAVKAIAQDNESLRDVLKVRTTPKRDVFKVTPSGQLEEISIEEHNASVTDEMQAIADEVTTDVNSRLSFFERLTNKRGG